MRRRCSSPRRRRTRRPPGRAAAARAACRSASTGLAAPRLAPERCRERCVAPDAVPAAAGGRSPTGAREPRPDVARREARSCAAGPGGRSPLARGPSMPARAGPGDAAADSGSLRATLIASPGVAWRECVRAAMASSGVEPSRLTRRSKVTPTEALAPGFGGRSPLAPEVVLVVAEGVQDHRVQVGGQFRLAFELAERRVVALDDLEQQVRAEVFSQVVVPSRASRQRGDESVDEVEVVEEKRGAVESIVGLGQGGVPLRGCWGPFESNASARCCLALGEVAPTGAKAPSPLRFLCFACRRLWSDDRSAQALGERFDRGLRPLRPVEELSRPGRRRDPAGASARARSAAAPSACAPWR